MTEQHYHHHFYHHHDPGLCEVKAEIAKLRDLIIRNQEALMATLDEVLAEVTDESGRLDSIQSLIDGIKQQLADALSGTALPPAVQQKVDAVFAGLTANKAKIDTALNAGTPPPA
jgi:hypothetical protein